MRMKCEGKMSDVSKRLMHGLAFEAHAQGGKAKQDKRIMITILTYTMTMHD